MQNPIGEADLEWILHRNCEGTEQLQTHKEMRLVMVQSRTHNCGQLRLPDVGEKVTLVGFYDNMRKVSKNLGFLILRDFYGITQVVVETEEMMDKLSGVNNESTLSITGTVRERSSKNGNLPTGEIEVVPEDIQVLGKCIYNELPFEINRSKEADEATRLKYRYLDLRNPAVKEKIVLRSKVVAELRQRMTGHDFLEITTPILTCSSPEGARDYLVPSRNHPGKFYALPQAPQQFKQLLMTSGFDRYFQIAPCFRDEDARADRSPGEFYQLDMEMAFASQEDVFAVIEDVLPPVFAKYGIYKEASKAPFARISYRDALEKYGSDKPDLRIDLVLQDATEVLADCGFGPFDGQCVEAIVVDQFTATRKVIDKICADVEVQSGQKAYWFKLDENGELVGGIAKFLQERKEAVIEKLGLKKGDFVGLTAGKKGDALKGAGVLRKYLGMNSEAHMKQNCYEFCWIVDFPMYEIGEEYPEVEIEVLPGVTAAMGGAAVLGAPLGHDCCLISLSDLLTPWELIEKRLRAAAQADFLIALYNPSSKKRKDYLARACDILLEYKEESIICGIVRNIAREEESMNILTLKELRNTEVDMFSTVYIGNKMTKIIKDKMVTPRGYRYDRK